MAKTFEAGTSEKKVGQIVVDYFTLWQTSVKARQGGGEYLSLTLADKTGFLEAKMWSGWEPSLKRCVLGAIVQVRGKMECYKGQWQLCLDGLRPSGAADDGKYDEADLIPVRPQTKENIPVMRDKLLAIVQAFQNEPLRTLVLSFLEDERFFQAPAAKMLHHAVLGGLLEHVLTLVQIIETIHHFYQEADRELVIAGAILHDFGKVDELDWKMDFTYTLEGQLIGHISIAHALLREKTRALQTPNHIRILLEHMILSHHGRYEFGSPKLPMTPEAILLSALDDLEAKFASMRREFSEAKNANKKEDETTDWVRSMERPLFNSSRYLMAEEALLRDRVNEHVVVDHPIDTNEIAEVPSVGIVQSGSTADNQALPQEDLQ